MKRKTIIFITTIILLAMMGCGNTSGETESNQTSAEMESALSQSQESQLEESQADVNTTPKADSVPKVKSKEFSADVNHDGKEDKIVLTVDSTDATMPTLVTVKVLSDQAEIYQDEIPIIYGLAYQYYLTEWEGQDYMLCYYPLLGRDMVTCRFEVFSLNEAGEKEILDSGEIEASILAPAELDKNEWLAYAEKENKYFENAYLLADTTNFKIESGDPEQKQGYSETFSWINEWQNVSYDTAEENLQLFMEQEINFGKEFLADVNHDGKEDKIIVTVDAADTTMPAVITVNVFSDETEIYQDEVPVTYALAYQYYLTEWEGQDYMLCYYPLVDHDMATCRFEVFSLNEAGEKEILDSGEIGASLVTPAELDKSEWLAFAEKENKYFENAYLLVDTTNLKKIESGDPEQKQGNNDAFSWLNILLQQCILGYYQKQGYSETFSWINVGQDVSYDTAEENLQHFMEQESDYD